MIRRCPQPPPYGSAAWLALPDGSPAKVAAVVIAAEAWARSGDNLERDLRTELILARKSHKDAEDADYVAGAAEHRDTWKHLANSPRRYAGQPMPPRPLRDIGAEHLRLIRGGGS